MLEGTYTAIVTPFANDGSVDFTKFKELVEFQIEGGVSGVVPVGTTGESPTLNVDEHQKVIETAIEVAAGRVKIVAGTGANSTQEAIELTRHAKEAGADATLQVTPYYNKPSDEGLIRHFSAVADIGLPVVLYNVPGRAGRAIPVSVIAKLASHPHVVSVKEAGGSVDRVSQILDVCDIEVLSGDDSLTFPMMSLGGVGVISVASNILPAEVSSMVKSALAGDWDKAREAHFKYYRLFNEMFMETNPVPVKTALAMMGKIEPNFRLPLCGMSEDLNNRLKAVLAQYGLL